MSNSPISRPELEVARLRSLLAEVEQAYSRFVPRELLRLLGARSITDVELGDQVERVMTVLFCDIRDFTSLAETMTPKEIFRFLNSYLGEMEPVISANDGIVDKFIGDAIMALFPASADDAVRGAVAMLARLRTYNQGRARAGYAPVAIGIGLNTGFVVIGTIGASARMEGTVVSDSVNVASRLEALTKTWHVPLLASEHTLYALSEGAAFGMRFLDRILVKGKRQPLSVYEVFEADPEAERAAKHETLADFEQGVAFYHLRRPELARPRLQRCLARNPADRPASIYLSRCESMEANGGFEGTGEMDGTLEWRDEFVLGVRSIDEEHAELLAAMNRISRQIRAGEAGGIDETLAFLVQYAGEHFRNEQDLMTRYEYPLRREHEHAHRRFVEFMHRVEGEIRSGTHDPLFLVFHIQLFLLDWFANHSTGTDRHLAKFLRAKGVPEAL